MAQQVINQEQVIKYLRVHRPSPMPPLRKLRDILGGGSLDTISRGVRAYLAEQSEIQKTKRPNDFSEVVAELEEPLWELLQPLIDEAKNQLRKKLQAEINAAKEAAESLEAECDELRRKDEARAAQLGRVMTEAAKADRELATTRVKLETSQETNTKLLQEISSLRTQLQAAETEKAKAQGALEAYLQALGNKV